MNFDANTIINGLVPILTPLLIAGLKWLVPRLPGYTIPVICTALGTLLSYIAQWAITNTDNVGLAVALGLASIGVREVLDQLKKVVVTPPGAPAKP